MLALAGWLLLVLVPFPPLDHAAASAANAPAPAAANATAPAAAHERPPVAPAARSQENSAGWAAMQAQLEAMVRAAYPNVADVTITSPEAARRLLPACPGNLVVDPQGTRLFGNLSVRVTCSTADQASTGRAPTARLPVAVLVRVPMLVARNAIPRGTVVASDMLALAPTPLGSASDYLGDVQGVLGQRTRMGLRAGQVLTLAQLEQGPLVSAGEQVALVAGDDAFSVSVAAKALQSGRVGEQIRVRNIASGRVVPAWVVSRGTTRSRPPDATAEGLRAAAAPIAKE